jgi:hypothetical protein
MLWAVVALIMSVLPMAAHAQITNLNDGYWRAVIFVGVDFHVHYLACPYYWDCSVAQNWVEQDMTYQAGGTAAGMFSSLASFTDAFGEHVFFSDGTQQLNQLSSSNHWNWTNTAFGVQSIGGLSGYSSLGEGNDASIVEARLFFETSDQHVHMLVSGNGGPFGNSDLTSLTGGTLAKRGTGFTSFHDSSGEHVFYLGADEHVYQLYGSLISYYICNPFTRICGPVSYIRWANQDLTRQANGPLGVGALASFSDSTAEHVFYIANDLQLHELQTGSAGWTDQDLSITARAILPNSTTGLTGLSNVMGEQSFYIGTDFNVHNIVLNSSGGSDEDLTTAMAQPCYGLLLTSFTRSTANQVESDVFYIANDWNIHKLSQTATLTKVGWLTTRWTDLALNFSISMPPLNRCIQ